MRPGGRHPARKPIRLNLASVAELLKITADKWAESGLREEACGNAVLACQICDRCPDGTALLVISLNVGAKSIEVGWQGLAAPNHRAGCVKVGDGDGEWPPLHMVELMIVALELAA